ncbi:MAG: hypothetical protein KKG76_08435 [Euryarchaeota archaeon]|nr:hypothetical protein [Euryarchaeota archaeon]MBU4139738.1 hypothetical protein [Euryarchaeota archaeon]
MKEKIEKEEKKEAEPVVKVLTPGERKRQLIEGIKKTAFPAFIGAFFALVLFLKFYDAKEVHWVSVLLLVALVSYYIQKLAYPMLGVKVDEFETKDWLYVELMTIIFLLVSWTLLLNSGALDVTVDPMSITLDTPENLIASVTSNSLKIADATVHLEGPGVNMSNITGVDGLAFFHDVKTTGPGNMTVTATKIGYIHDSMNITINK